jgi:hypothetical protein
MSCVELEHVVRSNMYTTEEYSSRQPSDIQRNDLELFMATSFFDGMENDTCFEVPQSSQEIYQVWEYLENGTYYCMLIEQTASFSSGGYSNRMTYGWPIVVRPRKRPVLSLRNISLHYSAPHIYSDQDSSSSAATLFVLSSGLSYISQTRERDALPGSTNCVEGGDTDGSTDGANTISELFFNMCKGIYTWQEGRVGGCPFSRCGFVQWHGTSTKACYDAYISVGSGDTSEYPDTNPAVKIANKFNSFSSKYTAFNPYTGDSCGYYAPRNTFGRLLNGIAESDICDVNVSPLSYSDKFVHIEPQPALRQSGSALNQMAAAILSSFSS